MVPCFKSLALRTRVCAAVELRLQTQVDFTDLAHLHLNGFAVLADFELLMLHTAIHFVKRGSLIVKVAILLLQNLLVLIQEASEVI